MVPHPLLRLLILLTSVNSSNSLIRDPMLLPLTLDYHHIVLGETLEIQDLTNHHHRDHGDPLLLGQGRGVNLNHSYLNVSYS